MNAMTATVRREAAESPPPSGRDRAFEAAARHSRRVRAMKTLLPAAAIGLFGTFILFSWTSHRFESPAVTIEDSAVADGKLVMANPRLGGVTKDNEPYSMTAARAVQDAGEGDVIHLESIDADLPVTPGNRARIVTDAGIYDRAAGTMKIETPITATTTDGMVAKLESAWVDMTAGSLKTERPVDITMRGAHVTAESMTVADRGQTIVFNRRVRLTIEPERVKTAGGAGAGDDGK